MKTVLLVEDDPFLNDLYATALERAGWSVERAGDAQAALDLLDDQPADVLVLDVFLPINNAFEIIQQLQSYGDWQKLPVILISSHRLSRNQLTPQVKQDLSICQFLYKPETLPQDLVKTVEDAV